MVEGTPAVVGCFAVVGVAACFPLEQPATTRVTTTAAASGLGITTPSMTLAARIRFPGTRQRRGSTGSLSSASTPNTHSCTR